VEGTTAVVGLRALAEESVVLELVADQAAGDENILGADHHDLLALEELLGHNGGQATEKVTLAVNDDGLIKMEMTKLKLKSKAIIPGIK